MGVKVMVDYPREGVIDEYPEADGWVVDDQRTLTVGIDDSAGAKKLAQYNQDHWMKVGMYDPITDQEKSEEPPL
jgi:hypothetical protein